MSYLLDTNVLSELWKPQPDAAVVRWFFAVDWFLPVPVIAEIQEGAENPRLAAAERIRINTKLDNFIAAHAPTVIEWDAAAARVWGRLKHSPEVRRQPQALWDSLIDALAVRTGYQIATRNTTDFRHGKTFDPWKS